MVHGLAASIRAAEESETFDLSGQNASTISNTIQDAFQKPFLLDDMIRITFVVGAGKQARQKYDDGAAKAVVSELNNCGYQEDRGASCVKECAGSYKLQHDTGKNLKTIVVFPMISFSETYETDTTTNKGECLIPINSPGYKIATSSMAAFQYMLNRQCPSWSQKKGCLETIEALKEILENIESKLMKGIPLDEPEQSFYDAVSELVDKETYVRNEMHQQVEKGNITNFEKDLLLEQNAQKLRVLKKEGKPTDKAMHRKDLLEKIEPVQPHPLRFEAEIRKLRKELIPLLQMEEKTKGRLLSVKETQTLSRKDEIVEEVEYLEASSRGWFEDDATFDSRLHASRMAYENKKAKKATKAATVGIGVDAKSSAISKWVLPGESKRRKRTATKPKLKLKGTEVFSAMVMDSDESEDESSGDDRNGKEYVNTQDMDDVLVAREIEPTTERKEADSKKAKKKKKKKKGRSDVEDSVFNEKCRPGEANEKVEETAVAQAIDFVTNLLIPLIVGFVTWLFVLLFGNQRKRSNLKVTKKN